jgi:hypothetical protein
MYRLLTALGLSLSTLVALANPTVATANKPIRMQEVLPVVPDTLEELFAESDDVMEVEILSSVVRAVGQPASPHVRTFYTAKVLRTRKGSAKAQVVFTQAAGELEFPDYILRVAGQPLKTGERYVVFLRRNDAFGGRMLVGERSGAFKIGRGGRIEPQGFGKIAEEQRSLTERSFGDELDRLSRRSISQR